MARMMFVLEGQGSAFGGGGGGVSSSQSKLTKHNCAMSFPFSTAIDRFFLALPLGGK